MKKILLITIIFIILSATAIAAYVEPEVEEELEYNHEVDVIIFLNEENVMNSLNINQRKDFVRENQKIALAKVAYKHIKDRTSKEGEYDFELDHTFKITNGFTGKITSKGLEKLRNNPYVKEIVLDENMAPQLSKSVPQISADDVWNIQGITGEGVTVCYFDTGLDYTHQDFGGCTLTEIHNGQCNKIVAAYDFYSDDNDPIDGHGHGTHVGGIIAANGNVKGVAPDAKITALKICNDGATSCPTSRSIRALEWCVTNKAKYNFSLVTTSITGLRPYSYPTCKTTMDSALQSVQDAGMLFTVCSGNQGATDGIAYPACSPYAFSVGNVDSADRVYSTSNRDVRLDIWAPGRSIYSTKSGNKYGTMTGTSMSNPHVIGSAALMIQYYREQGAGEPTVEQLKQWLKTSPTTINDAASGTSLPRVDPYYAIQNIVIPNRAPVLEYIADITVTEGDLVKIIPNASDKDGDNLTFYFSRPLNASGEWQTAIGNAGIYNMTIKVSDGQVNTTQNFMITVEHVNRAPVLELIENITVKAGEMVVISPVASDPDNDSLTYYYDRPLDENGKWQTDYNEAGEYVVAVKVSDGKLNTSQDVKITVEEIDPLDLRIEEVKAKNPKAGELAKIRFILINTGNEDLRNVEYRIDTNSSDKNPERRVPLLNASSSMKVYVSWTYSEIGNYDAKVIIDYDDEIPETDESNNEQSFIVNVS